MVELLPFNKYISFRPFKKPWTFIGTFFNVFTHVFCLNQTKTFCLVSVICEYVFGISED